MRFFVAGYGKFGRLAVVRLRQAFPDAPVTALEPYLEPGQTGSDTNVELVQLDAVSFLSTSSRIAGQDWIIPMVPFHLAASLVLATLPDATAVPIPKGLSNLVPNPYPVDHTCLCSSVADFMCPDSCPEGNLCSVTGESRVPLCLRLKEIRIPNFTTKVLRSRQILPGVGGYQAADLTSLTQQIGHGSHIVATSCKCHAILTGINRDTKTIQ